jgi:hypothetical protein
LLQELLQTCKSVNNRLLTEPVTPLRAGIVMRERVGLFVLHAVNGKLIARYDTDIDGLALLILTKHSLPNASEVVSIRSR